MTVKAMGGLCLLAGFAMPLQAAEAPAPQVQLFSPQGTVRGVRQVTARFSTPLVALGDPRLPDPFDIDCPRPGQGRWADSRNWVYDFEADLPAGIACEFRLSDSLRTADGRALGGTRVFRFDTGGPAVRASLPFSGAGIDAEQVFLLALDAPAPRASVLAHAACAIDNVGERIPVDVLEGPERERILAQRRDLGFQYFNLLRQSGRDPAARPETEELRRAEAAVTVLRCRRALPPDTRVRLLWGAGIAAQSGIATTQDQVLDFRTRENFTVRMSCERVNAESSCLPMLPVRVNFSAPVPRALALATQLTDASGRRYPVTAPGEAQTATVEGITFAGPFPENGRLTLTLAPDLKDDAGRVADNAGRFPLELEFDAAPPLAKFSGTFGILEAAAGGVLPVTLRNVESPVAARQAALPAEADIPGRSLRVTRDAEIATWLRRVETAMAPRGTATRDPATGEYRWHELTGSDSAFAGQESATFAVPKPGGGREFEVVGIPLTKPGFYVVELASPRLGAALLGEDRPRYVATTALVTNLAVHFKWGRESSRVWVTALDTGRPVSGAQILISGYCRGNVLWEGETDRHGLASPGALDEEPGGANGCYGGVAPQPLMVSARIGGDMSFTLSSWQNGIEPYAFSVPVGSSYGAQVVHTVLDRSLFRAGETVAMKHFFRRRVSGGFETPAQAPTRLTLTHAGSDQQYSLPVRFDAGGIAETSWTIPADARLGEYRVMLEGPDRRSYFPATFRVEQFRVPTMEAVIQPPAKPLVNPRSADLDLYVGYLSGGGAADAPVTVRTLLEPRAVAFRDYPEYSFGGEPVREGATEPNAGDDAFWLFATRFGSYSPETEAGPAAPAQVHPAMLDRGGAARVTVSDLPASEQPRTLLAELEYQDANGERLATATRIPLWPAALSLGLRLDGWAATRDRLRFQVVAVGLDGKPLPDQPVEVRLFRRDSYSYRKRLIGGFYAYESSTAVARLPVSCTGRTNARGLLFCDVAPDVDGQVLLEARARDAAGNTTYSSTSAWVVGEGDWWFDPNNADRMDVLPERREYQPGETARFQVRMPFRSATALVTVEREGVLESFVTELSGREPVVEVPVRGEFAPNMFVSVLAVRGRVTPLQSWLGALGRKLNLPGRFESGGETALVDLAKPAFKLGLAQVRVGWSANRLVVTATTDREVYRARETANVEVAVRRANGEPLPAGAEVALAVVDEGLLELSDNGSWQLLDAMMGERGLEVWTSTAQMQVVGKRHYGRKAVAPGGGGGRGPARELFDTLLLWQGRVVLDAQGRARIPVTLNDSLSAFRVVAIASAGASLFGTGQTTIRTNQDLMLHAGLPTVVREGDRFTAAYTVRNAAERAMTVVAQPAYRLNGSGAATVLPAQTVELAAGTARELTWPVAAPVDATSLAWETSATEQGGAGSDRLRTTQRIVPAFPVRTVQATLTQLEPSFSMPVAPPQGAIPGRGGIELTLRAKLGDGLEGVREYMNFYPYTCLEQRLSQAVALQDRARWDAEMARLTVYIDESGLLRYFPLESLRGSDVLTAYALALSDEAGWPIPDNLRQRLLNGLKGFVAGRIVRDSALPTADLTVRKVAAIAALSRYAAATADMLSSFAIEPNLWPTSAVLDWVGILKRTRGIERTPARLAEAKQILRARLNFQGTTLNFSTEAGDRLWWLMVSGDLNATRAVLALLDEEEWREDLPRLVRGMLGRQRRGHWDTTTANAWGVLALQKFSARFETVPVTGTTQARLGDERRSVDWQAAPAAPVTLPFGGSPQTLSVTHAGAGRPWVIVQSKAALPLTAPLFTGYRIRRAVTPIEQKSPGVWTRGDVARITLSVDAQADMSWVVLDDPVPSGASILGTGLGRDATVLSRGERSAGRAWPAYEERRTDAFRAYYEYVPKGEWTVEYTVRFNNPGTFILPATRVEAMYAPEMFGELPNDVVTVGAGS